MDDLPELKRTIIAKAPRKGMRQVLVFGHRDPRGPDNHIYIWVGNDGKLHIRVQKAQTCYQFERMIDTAGYVELIAK